MRGRVFNLGGGRSNAVSLLQLTDEIRHVTGRDVDVRFEDTVAHPVETVEKVYAHLGLDYTPEVAEGVRAYLAANPRDKHGTHTYTLEEFGLDHDEVATAFAAYNERFGG